MRPKRRSVANYQAPHYRRNTSPRCPSGEHQMRKRTICMVAALFLASAPLAQAQGGTSTGSPQESERLSPTERKILTDARVAAITIALQLTSEQQQYWPAVEEAIRARAEGRYRRLAALEGRISQTREVDPVRLYRERADSLAQRAAELRRLADAWQPLQQSLSPDQKARLRLVAVRVLGRISSAADSRRTETARREKR